MNLSSASGRVGILGGTFDPVHNAHLAMARAALDQLELDRILFMPTGNPHYRTAAVASGEDRVAMLELALQGEPRYAVDARELAGGATGYTVDTLRSLDIEKPWLLMGADQYAKLDTWHRPDEVRRLAGLAVFARPGSKIRDREARVVAMPEMKISASAIRARTARGEDLSALVPPAVANYIVRKRLYR